MPSDLDLLFFEDMGMRNTKLNTRESLLEMLNKYRGILTRHTTDYLNSLIELEFSVIRDCISREDRDVLSELEVYRRIAVYNIYNRALNILKQTSYDISTYEDGFNGLCIYAKTGNAKELKVFDFNYGEGSAFSQPLIPSNYKNMTIGDIALFQTIENKKLREVELARVIDELERLYNQKNPYYSSANTGVIGGPAYQWDLEHAKAISEYEEQFRKLDGKQELSDEDKIRIEMTKEINALLLEDYGLTHESFEDDDSSRFSFVVEETSELQKTLVKRIPGITIKNNIEYI